MAYMEFQFVLKTNSDDEQYESERAKGLVERILGRDNVWEWNLVETKPYDYQPVNP